MLITTGVECVKGHRATEWPEPEAAAHSGMPAIRHFIFPPDATRVREDDRAELSPGDQEVRASEAGAQLRAAKGRHVPGETLGFVPAQTGSPADERRVLERSRPPGTRSAGPHGNRTFQREG